MSEKTINGDLIKKTQEILGKFVKKPALTEKLLSRPPFRFLHDVIKAIIKETGYLKGLYTATELNHENIKDRESKIQFLQKLIDTMKLITKEEIKARPSKIVAGQEPENTNMLLQIIGTAITKKMNFNEAIDLVLSGKHTKSNSKGKSQEKNLQKKETSKEQKILREKEKQSVKEKKAEDNVMNKENLEKNAQKKKVDTKQLKEDKRKITTKNINEKTIGQNEDVQESKENINKETVSLQAKSIEKKETSEEKMDTAKNIEPKLIEKVNTKEKNDMEFDSSESKSKKEFQEQTLQNVDQVKLSKKIEVIKSATEKNSNKIEKSVTRQSTFVRENTNINGTHKNILRPPSVVRPASARPAPPRRREKNIEIVLQPNEESAMNSNQMKFGNLDNEMIDDGDTLVIIDNTDISDKVENQSINDKKGHLVQQILETQKELAQQTEDTTKTIDLMLSSDVKSTNQSSTKQMNTLRDVIQNLSRCINPLGKLMDYLPENIDSMQSELIFWRNKNMQTLNEIKKEKSLTETTLEPLRIRLTEIENGNKQYKISIENCRADILQNLKKITHILTEKL